MMLQRYLGKDVDCVERLGRDLLPQIIVSFLMKQMHVAETKIFPIECMFVSVVYADWEHSVLDLSIRSLEQLVPGIEFSCRFW